MPTLCVCVCVSVFALLKNVKRKLLSVLREQKIPLKELRTFFTECNSESTTGKSTLQYKTHWGTGIRFKILPFSDDFVLCLTVSNITAVTIADPSFPFGFNSTQFGLYLDITVLQDNLAAITEKVVDSSLQTVILNKLNQVSSTDHWLFSKCTAANQGCWVVSLKSLCMVDLPTQYFGKCVLGGIL